MFYNLRFKFWMGVVLAIMAVVPIPPVSLQIATRAVIAKDFDSQCLKAHNLVRKVHGAPELRVDKALIKKAKVWAKGIVDVVDTEGIPSALKKRYLIPRNPYYGASMAIVRSGDLIRFENDTIDGGYPVRFWYFTEYPRHFAKAKGKTDTEFNPDTQHFTQMIWKSTARLGSNATLSRDGHLVIVCMYRESGNIPGQYAMNVEDRSDVNPTNWDKWLEDPNFVKYHHGKDPPGNTKPEYLNLLEAFYREGDSGRPSP